MSNDCPKRETMTIEEATISNMWEIALGRGYKDTVIQRWRAGGHEMKMMLAAAILFFQAGSVIAGSCSPIEDAELKDMSSEKLVKTYCTYLELGLIEDKTVMEILERESKAARQGLSTASFEKDGAQHNASAHECRDQQRKIRSALVNRSVSADLNCEAQ